MRPVELLVSDPRLQIDEASLVRCVLAIDSHGGFPVPPGSLEVAFVDGESCCRLHQLFFGDPDITDVMTFPGDAEDAHAGDIAICPAVAGPAARLAGLPFNEELTLYLVHGCLHLAGLDDRTESDQRAMRSAEDQLMRHLRAAGALLDATWMA